MNQEETNKLFELYEQGLTSSKQEADLLETFGDSKNDNHLWFKFLKNHKKNSPENLESHIWSTIQSIEKKKSKFILRVASIAASITLIFSIIFIANPKKPIEMSYEEKAAVLKEALAMFPSIEEPETSQEILYEDDLIIIYSEK